MSSQAAYKIQNIPEEERPRERFLRHGSEALSLAELIAIILGSGMKDVPVMQLAQNIVSHFGSLEKLSEATIEEFCQIRGLGKAKAIKLKAGIDLGLRVNRAEIEKSYKIQNPVQVYRLVRDKLQHEQREHFLVVLLDIKGAVITTLTVSIGTLSKSLVHPREVFYPAIRHKAASIILVHNHPSGDPTPSSEDIETTLRLIDVGKMVGIAVNDHLIIGRTSFISLRQEKLVVFN